MTTGGAQDPGSTPGSPALLQIEEALRISDGGALSPGWPAKYTDVVSLALGALAADEQVRAAWRVRTLGPAQRAGAVGLLVVTDRQVLGADRSSKGQGLFAVPASAVASVEIGPHVAADAVLGGMLRLRDATGAVLGTPEHPAHLQVIAPGHDPSVWDAHVRYAADLTEVADRLQSLLPGVSRFTPESKPLEPPTAPVTPATGSPAAAALADRVGLLATCALCGQQRPIAKVVTVYTAIVRSASRGTGGAFRETETKTEITEVRAHHHDVCVECERKDTRTMVLMFAPSLVAAAVLLVLWLVAGISGWWFLLLALPLAVLGAVVYGLTEYEERLRERAVQARQPGLAAELAGRPGLYAGWVDRAGRPIETHSAVVGYTEHEFKSVRQEMERAQRA